MLTITQRAAQELKAILEANARDSNHVLRIDTECDGFSLWLGPEVEGDALAGSEDTVFLHVSPELNHFLVGASVIIDCRESSDGPRLVVFREDDLSGGKRPSRRRASAVRQRKGLSSKAAPKSRRRTSSRRKQ